MKSLKVGVFLKQLNSLEYENVFKFSIFLLPSQFLFPVSSPVSWQKDCAGGPESWCQDLQTAVECGAVELCQQTVWKQQPMVSKSIRCNVCKILVSLTGRILQDNCTEVSSLTIPAAFRAIGTENLDSSSTLSPRRISCLTFVHVNADQFCHVCQIVISYIDDELLKNETLIEIGDMLSKGCQVLPDVLMEKCDELVDQYEPGAVRLLVQMMDPNFVCTKIRVCRASEEDLIGADRCVWGPSYWCKNMETAVECHAVEHCKRHIWD
uniref:Prosaposin n=1 Tax=Crocodylus porosus TaxID=8502 RepID=A0A7M4EGI1_CROPO